MSKIGPLDKKRPLILVTNDDGITAPGIRCLIDVMNELREVVVIAPDSPQSAMGHAITINSTLHCQKVLWTLAHKLNIHVPVPLQIV